MEIGDVEADPVSPREFGRVLAIGDDGHTIRVMTSSGNPLTLTGDDLDTYEVGASVILGQIDGQNFILPSDLEFQPPHWIGVIKHVDGEDVVVEVGGRFILMARQGIECEVGYTVIGDEGDQITRVLARRPLKYFELPGDQELDVQHFRSKPSDLTFEDFGGYLDVVKRAKELIEVPLRKAPELERIGARSIRGVIFSGEPGTDKTLLAKIIASTSGSTYYEISGPEIMSKWYGDAEATLREIFADAQQHSPSIIVVDEIDSIASQRSDDSHEASKRVVAQLLTLMDGLKASRSVVVATTNRVNDLDKALRRPGRFDWEVEFGLPTLTDREAILRASARRLQVRGRLDHAAIAIQADGWTPAELAAIWSEAALLAAVDDREAIAQEDYYGGMRRVQRTRVERMGRR